MPRRLERPGRSPARTAFIILEYCGGARTDALFERISRWNQGVRILVLDNASPINPASCVTHRNRRNSYVGGGIRDCIALALSLGATYLFYCVNDADLPNPLVIADFQAVMDNDPDVVLVSCSLSPDSQQARRYPWMVRRRGGLLRRVRAADPICCLLRLDFIESFGGFPESKGGWGYASEVAYHARKQGKKIYVSDRCSVRHSRASGFLVTERGETISKGDEAVRVYSQRYGTAAKIYQGLEAPDFDEAQGLRPSSKT